MQLKIDVDMHYGLLRQTDILMQIEVAAMQDQRVLSSHLDLSPTENIARIHGKENIGERLWLRMSERLACRYQAIIEIDRPDIDLTPLAAVPPYEIPGDVVPYLLPSRYCPADECLAFVESEFGHYQGGARIAAMAQWVQSNIAYISGASGNHTTAMDSLIQRQGICRDFAHILIMFARASAIPARFVSCYAPKVKPQDFHAVAEIYLNGAWHLVDPTGMASAIDIARIGVGLDAAEVAFLNSYGPLFFNALNVNIQRL